jgi:hypothetical protein
MMLRRGVIGQRYVFGIRRAWLSSSPAAAPTPTPVEKDQPNKVFDIHTLKELRDFLEL